MKILCPYKPHVLCEVDVAPIADVSMGYPTMHLFRLLLDVYTLNYQYTFIVYFSFDKAGIHNFRLLIMGFLTWNASFIFLFKLSMVFQSF